MIKFKQLYDPKSSSYYTIDGKTMIFKVTSDEINKETRLKPHFAAILLELFSKHPAPVSYAIITSILQNNNFICSDETRLHRKVSELRLFLAKFYPALKQIICNIRGVGYGLQLYLKDPEINTPLIRITNKKIQNIIANLQEYIKESLELSKKCSIIKIENGFILERNPIHQNIENLLKKYENQIQKIFSEVKYHSSDFIMIRLELILAKLKTYLGLARISEFSITKTQWLDWHEHEAKHILEKLISLLKQTENEYE